MPAPKRLKVSGEVGATGDFAKKELPKKLQIMDEDDVATRDRKRKQIKAFKGKQRMAEMDAEQNAKKSSWQSFQTKVGGKKKAGFVSKKVGSTKESIFSVPQGVGARVGVTGSGKGITDFERKRRHEYDN